MNKVVKFPFPSGNFLLFSLFDSGQAHFVNITSHTGCLGRIIDQWLI